MKKFKTRKGQTDYTNIHWAPVINCILFNGRQILLVKRSSRLNFYPGYWNGISGFLDDSDTLKDKVLIELKEELNINKRSVKKIKLGRIFHQTEKKYNKTWIVHPILVEVGSVRIDIDWEADRFGWFEIAETKNCAYYQASSRL